MCSHFMWCFASSLWRYYQQQVMMLAWLQVYWVWNYHRHIYWFTVTPTALVLCKFRFDTRLSLACFTCRFNLPLFKECLLSILSLKGWSKKQSESMVIGCQHHQEFSTFECQHLSEHFGYKSTEIGCHYHHKSPWKCEWNWHMSKASRLPKQTHFV